MADGLAAQMNRVRLNPTVVEKRAPGTFGQPVEVKTNITPITLKRDVSYFKYDIRMYAIFPMRRDGTEGVKELSKQTRDDFTEQQRKTACAQIFQHLRTAEATFSGILIYDRAAILFSIQKLQGITTTEKRFYVPANVQTVCPEALRVEVTIKEVADSHVTSSNDLASCVNAGFHGGSLELMEVLNLATSQTPFFSNDFVVYGNGNIYLRDPRPFFRQDEFPQIGNDKWTGIGLSKSVKILEGYNQPGSKDYMPALVLDVKKTAFHNTDQPLIDKVMAMYRSIGRLPRLETLHNDLVDMHCLCTHKSLSIIIGGFTPGPIEHATFTDTFGKTNNVVHFYQQKYNVQFIRLDFPGVIAKHSRSIYPMEVLKVACNQRVKGTQNTKETVESLIRVSAIRPHVRMGQTERLTPLLQLNSNAAVQRGVSVPDNQLSLSVHARFLNTVNLLGGPIKMPSKPGDSMTGADMKGPSWKPNPATKFVVGATVPNWAAVLVYSTAEKTPYNPFDVFQRFTGRFVDAGKRKGMTIPEPTTNSFNTNGTPVDSVVTQMVKWAAETGCKFVLVVSDDRLKTHAQLKCDEFTFKLTTQEVTLAKAAEVALQNRNQTLENIIMKTNVKLRGMNHVVKDGGIHQATTAMIMGLFVEQPRRMIAKEVEGGSCGTSVKEGSVSQGGEGRMDSKPAMIGLSANNAKLEAALPLLGERAAQQYFTCSWKYANPRESTTGETQLETMKMMVVKALEAFKTNRGGELPKQVVVYRGGVSEGQLPYIASAEREMFLKAFSHINIDYKPDLVIIACSKEHNERFYKVIPSVVPGDREDTNLQPGLVVDKVIVNPELNEFYLQSHRALQGTARATKYTLLCDSTGKLTNDQIQHMTNALCHLHEVVNSTTAVPTPLYVAEEAAKRASNCYEHAGVGPFAYDLDVINEELAREEYEARINA